VICNKNYNYPSYEVMEREKINSTWRIVQNSCWTQIPIPQVGSPESPSPNFALVPCDTSECCMVEVEVCRWGNPRRINITVLTTWEDIDECSSQYKSYYDPHTTGEPPFEVYHCCSYSQCNNTCEDWLNDLNAVNYNEQWKMTFEDDSQQNDFKNNLRFIQTNDELILEIINSKENEITTINIIDILGRPIFNKSINLLNGSTRIVINTSNFKTGVYFINTNINGINSSNHKILIVR
jgi:hypothetical protein